MNEYPQCTHDLLVMHPWPKGYTSCNGKYVFNVLHFEKQLVKQ